MLNFLDMVYIATVGKIRAFVNELKEEELGVSAFVATILLILIVVLLSALFWDKISQWFETTWNKIMNSANTIQ